MEKAFILEKENTGTDIFHELMEVYRDGIELAHRIDALRNRIKSVHPEARRVTAEMWSLAERYNTLASSKFIQAPDNSSSMVDLTNHA